MAAASANSQPSTSSKASPAHSRGHSRPAIKAKLSRRWSLDNINSKEGYVKDLRKQHQAQQVGQRDEAYPFMITERRRSRIGSLSSASGLDMLERRPLARPLSSSPPGGHFSAVKRTRTLSLDEDVEDGGQVASGIKGSSTALRTRSKRLGSVPTLRGLRKGPFHSSSGSSQDISIVPEDLEMPTPQHPINNHNNNINSSSSGMVNEPSAFLRKRSSSLPRILPPILDRDCFNEDDLDDEVIDDVHEVGSRLSAFKQMDQTSNLIVREMQKFVCKFASDVTQVLPLPLPANSRQQIRLAATGGNTSKKKLDWKHTQVLLKSIAKLHAISYAIRVKSPGLFDEIVTSLEASSTIRRQVDLDNRSVLVKILESRTPLVEEGCYDEVIRSVRSQASELYNSPMFPVIVHGNIKNNLAFRYNETSDVVGVKLPSLRYACVGSPLLDIYAAIFSQDAQFEVASAAFKAFLQTYHASFNEVASYLQVNMGESGQFSLTSLEAAFKKYELTGMIISSVKRSTVELGRSCSVGGRDMIFMLRGQNLDDLGSDLSKLALDIPFSHDEEDDEDLLLMASPSKK